MVCVGVMSGLPATLPAATQPCWNAEEWIVLPGVRCGRQRLTTRSPPASVARATGSLHTCAPAASVVAVRPPNRSVRSAAGSTAVPGPPSARRATWAAPMVSGVLPNSFVSRTRTARPATLRCTICRSVTSSERRRVGARHPGGRGCQPQIHPPPAPCADGGRARDGQQTGEGERQQGEGAAEQGASGVPAAEGAASGHAASGHGASGNRGVWAWASFLP